MWAFICVFWSWVFSVHTMFLCPLLLWLLPSIICSKLTQSQSQSAKLLNSGEAEWLKKKMLSGRSAGEGTDTHVTAQDSCVQSKIEVVKLVRQH